MKRLAIILAVFVSLFSMSLSARELVELPTKSISLNLNEDLPNSRPVFSLVQLVQPIDSTENQGKAVRIATGVVEVIGGCGILYAGIAGLGAGMVVHLFRPEDRRELIALYSLGAAGTALGLVVIDDGLKRTGLKGLFLFRSKSSSGKPGVFFPQS